MSSSHPVLAAGNYRLYSVRHSGSAVGVDPSHVNSRLVAKPVDVLASDVPIPLWEVRVFHSGKVLLSTRGLQTRAQYDKVYACTHVPGRAEPGQKWTIEPAGNDRYRIHGAGGVSWAVESGTRVELHKSAETDSQAWLFERVHS